MNFGPKLAVLGAALLAACGGGGGGGGGNPAPPGAPQQIPTGTLDIGGVISVAPFLAADADTNNPSSDPAGANNRASAAQIIPNPGTVGGYVNEPGQGNPGPVQVEGDRHDFYRVSLLEGQTIRLTISDHIGSDPFRNDLDLLLVEVDLFLNDFSAGIGSTEQLSAPYTGEFIIVVTTCAEVLFEPGAVTICGNGASNYILSVGQGAAALATDTLVLSHDFVPLEAVADMNAPDGLTAAASSLGAASEPKTGVQLVTFPQPPLRVAASNVADEFIALRPGQSEKLHTLASIKSLMHSGDANWAEPNYRVKTQFIPNDPGWEFHWHYRTINLPGAWDQTLGDPNVTVAVIDTGVLGSHPDLAGQLVPGYDFVSSIADGGDGDGIDPDPEDPGDSEGAGFRSSFHGTHVTGTVAASTNNNAGVVGTAPDVKLMPIRTLGVNGDGTSFDVRRGICYAAGLQDTGSCPAGPENPNPVDIINLSLGGGPFSSVDQAIFNEVRAAGVTVVAAAGNESSSAPFYPAAYDNVVAVSATTITNQLAPYSSFGGFVDVAAPGGNLGTDINGDGFGDGVLSTGADDSLVVIDYVYVFKQGTSMAAPHVAGVFALMKSLNSSLGPDDFDQLLAAGELTNSSSPGTRTSEFGFGLINAQKAVVAALTAPGGGTPPPPAPWLGVAPLTLNFGATLDSVEFELRNNAGGTLDIITISASPDSPGVPDWLLEPAPAGLGSYTLQVDRSGLPNGTYAGTVTVVSTVNVVQIPVIMQVSNAAVDGDAGPIFIRLLDDATGAIREVTATATDGEYSWAIDDLPPGRYQLFAFSDADNDGEVCDQGEACGAFITTDQPLVIDLQADNADLDFPISYEAEAAN